MLGARVEKTKQEKVFWTPAYALLQLQQTKHNYERYMD